MPPGGRWSAWESLAPLAFGVVRRLCERPGCGATAEVSYGIDKNNLLVWVDNRAILERELAGRLCRRHANALVPPRGWTLDDRREPIPKLFITREDASPARDPRPRTVRGTRNVPAADPAPVLEFPAPPASTPEPRAESVDRAVSASAADAGSTHAAPVVIGSSDDVRELTYESDDASDVGDQVDPDETQAVPWSPRLVRAERGEDPSGPVFGRLLGRAFGVRDQERDQDRFQDEE